ncbi:MAG: hypothetical protein ACJ8FY_26570 [Gemmataceae bacterium]
MQSPYRRTMILTHEELESLSAWAREEWEPAYYRLASHRLQLDHGVSSGQLVLFIKAWTESEGKKDLDNAQPWTRANAVGDSWRRSEFLAPVSLRPAGGGAPEG